MRPPNGRPADRKVLWAPLLPEGPLVTSDNRTLDDDVMCLVEVPERWETITRRVVKSPAAVREVEVPAEYSALTRQVIDQPAAVREIPVPALTKVVNKQVLKARVVDTPASASEMLVPAVYKTISRQGVDPYLNLETVKSLGVASN